MEAFLRTVEGALPEQPREPLAPETPLKHLPGLDSLGRIMVAAELQGQLGLTPAAADWEEAPTLGALYERLQARKRGA